MRLHLVCIVVAAVSALATDVAAQEVQALGIGNWLTVSTNVDAGLRQTQFFEPHYNTSLFQWDGRLELWLPPFRDKFSWGGYVRTAGIVGSKNEWFQNAWLARPGVGFQAYPLSASRFQDPASKVGKIAGPIRGFVEFNSTDYWGAQNDWRPHHQIKAGLDYWRAVNVNEPQSVVWLEMWNGALWQSANDVTIDYKSYVLATAIRVGVRKPHAGLLSNVTPYGIVTASRTKYDTAGTSGCPFQASTSVVNPCDFYWENNASMGVGLRYAPSLRSLNGDGPPRFVTRLVVYFEYMRTTAYYGPVAPAEVPRFDVRAGVSANIGRWYR